MYQNGGLGQPNQLDTAPQGDVPCWAVEPSPSVQGGFKMIESIEIKNFRCFEEVSLNNLETINLIVGPNASGKTAFLEALYFTLGGPALAFKLRAWRGLGSQVQFTDYTESRNAVWRDLFHNFEQNTPVVISFRGTGELERTVRIRCHKKESQFVKKGKVQVTEIPPIEFQYSRGLQTIAVVKPQFSGEGIVLANGPEPAHGSFFPSTMAIDPAEIARHFSSLSKQGKIGPVVVALRKLFPIIEDLTLELENDRPIVYASIEGASEKMPVGMISSGISKLVALLVAIANQKGGVVIVDEIENGLYHKTMVSVWKTLHSVCKEYKVQLFASTHSEECLLAASDAASGVESDYTLLRAKIEPGKSVIRQFDGITFRSAEQQHVEIR